MISRALLDEVLRPGLEGEVHSTFARACNLQAAGSLIGLVSPDLGIGPHAVVVTPPPGGFAASGAWQPGVRFRLEGGRLMLSMGGGVNLRGAALWDPEPVPPEAAGDLATGAERLGRALEVLGPAGGICEPVLDLWKGRPPSPGPLSMAHPRVAALREACLSEGPQAAALRASALVGLGPGLTPSGDDFLAGLTATLVRAVRWGMAPAPLVGVAGSLAALLADGCRGRTTLPSESMLGCAARGWLVEAASNLVTGLLGGTSGAMTSLHSLLAIGHTSGADTAAGIYMALRLLGI